MELVPDCFFCDYKNHTVLQCARHETIERINDTKSFSVFSKGSYLYRSGEASEGFYFLKQGLVRSFVIGHGGKEQTFHLKTSGDWIGFRESVSGSNFYHNAVAIEETQACFISRGIVEELVLGDVKFQKEVFRQMAKDWKQAEEKIVSLGTKQVHEKLAEILIILDQSQGSKGIVEIKVTREVLATLIGTQTETLVRALGDLKARHYISVEKNTITIENAKALQNLSESHSTPVPATR